MRDWEEIAWDWLPWLLLVPLVALGFIGIYHETKMENYLVRDYGGSLFHVTARSCTSPATDVFVLSCGDRDFLDVVANGVEDCTISGEIPRLTIGHSLCSEVIWKLKGD